MARKVLESCPSCGGTLEVTEMRCVRCETQVRGRFSTCDFCSLSDEQSTFLRIFLTSRGNLSEVEKRLGVSYPTVRAKLDEVIARLEAPQASSAPQTAREQREVANATQPQEHTDEAHTSPERRAILDAVARGEISTLDGLEQLRQLGGNDNE